MAKTKAHSFKRSKEKSLPFALNGSQTISKPITSPGPVKGRFKKSVTNQKLFPGRSGRTSPFKE